MSGVWLAGFIITVQPTANAGATFLVIMAAGHHFMETPEGDALVAFALPR